MVHPGVVCIAGPVFLIAAVCVADRLTLTSDTDPSPVVVQTDDSATAEAPSSHSHDSNSSFPALQTVSAPDHSSTDRVIAEPASQMNGARSSTAGVATSGDAELRSLLQQLAPDASPDMIDVWVETYRGMAAEDITFLMQQRHDLGIRLPTSLLETSDLTPADSTPVAVPLPSADGDLMPLRRALSAAAGSIRRNLLFSSTPGYRREIFVLNVGPADESRSTADGDIRVVSHSTTSVSGTRAMTTSAVPAVAAVFPRAFGVGVHVPSASRLHVALRDDAELMFRFDDGLLSRRGDFRILSDGRIGITIPAGELPLFESPIVSPDVIDVRIDPHAAVTGTDSSGQPVHVGTLPIVRCRCLNELQSEDGIYFRVADAGDLEPVDPETVFLHVQTVEYSSVDRNREWQELDHIQRMLTELHGLID